METDNQTFTPTPEPGSAVAKPKRGGKRKPATPATTRKPREKQPVQIFVNEVAILNAIREIATMAETTSGDLHDRICDLKAYVECHELWSTTHEPFDGADAADEHLMTAGVAGINIIARPVRRRVVKVRQVQQVTVE